MPLIDQTGILNILQKSPDATAIYSDQELTIAFANKKMLEFWGKKGDIIGSTLPEGVPELLDQPFIDLLKEVWRSGKTYSDRGQGASLMTCEGIAISYYDFIYEALIDEQGETYAILHTASEVSDRITTEKKVIEKDLENQTLISDLQALNEEFKTTNEELQAVSEEYQTTNEELEVVNEELHLSNARYATANDLLNKAFDQLAATEAEARLLLKSAPVAMGIIELKNGLIESANDQLLNIWGLKSDSVGRSYRKELSYYDAMFLTMVANQMKKMGETVKENDLQMGGQHLGPVDENFFNFVYQPIQDSNGNTVKMLIVASDVTGQTQERLRAESVERMLNLAILSAELGTWELDLKSNELKLSPRGCELFGFPTDCSIELEDLLKLTKDSYRESLLTSIDQSLDDGELLSVELLYTHLETADERWVMISGIASKDADTEKVTISGVLDDITDQKMDEQRKTDFINIVSHEMKTPLTAQRGVLQLAQREASKLASPMLDELIARALTKGEAMSTLINGFLDTSRLKAGKIYLNPESFDLGNLVEEILADRTPGAAENHPISTSMNNCATIYGDRQKIGQVIQNLLGNAVKYSPAGGNITINCLQEDDFVEVGVADQGMGISEQNRDLVFSRFFRVKNQATQNISGFGLGLYLCAEIIKRHQGRIWVENSPGGGSTFRFRLPSGVRELELVPED